MQPARPSSRTSVRSESPLTSRAKTPASSFADPYTSVPAARAHVVRDIAQADPLPRLLTTAEAAVYLRFRSTSGIRTAVYRGELRPIGAGPKCCHMFTVDELDR